MLLSYLSVSESSCKLISSPSHIKGRLSIPIVLELKNDILEPKIVVTKKQLIKNPNIIRNLSDAISDSLLLRDKSIVNVELEDLKAILNHSGVAYIDEAQCTGHHCAGVAIDIIVKEIPLLKISGAIFCFKIHPDFPIIELAEAMELVYKNISDDADIIFSILGKDTLSVNEVQVSIIYSLKEETKVLLRQVVFSKSKIRSVVKTNKGE